MNNARRQNKSSRLSDVGTALRQRMTMFTGVGVFSGVINLLALTGSMYMLQVYDRVIPSRSLPTLIGLSLLMLGLYLVNGLLDMLRARIMSRIGLKFDKDLRASVFDIVLSVPLKMSRHDKVQPIQDLDQIRSFLATPGPVALFDMPWIPVFVMIIYWMHPWLGLLAVVGAAVLMVLAVLTDILSRKPVRAAAASGASRQIFSDAARRNAEVIRALGMGERMKAIWIEQSRRHLTDHLSASDVVGGLGAATKVLRMILQSAMLGLGAYLVILGEASPGVMIAGSILLSRALAPIEIAIANWRGFIAARQSYRRLQQIFSVLPQDNSIMPLPGPHENLRVEDIWVAAPGDTQPIICNISFTLSAGDGLGIIGKSASGKSTLARAVVGIWEPLPQRGVVRLDGAGLDQWAPAQLGQYIGYLPQEIELFDGTIAQNIARFDPEMTSGEIIAAATKAGVHDMILKLRSGYDTPIGQGGEALSAGQRQRIGLARALYGDPFLVVLDEPNSNLDREGELALSSAIKGVRARGGIAIVIAHRSSALANVDQVLAIADGKAKAFGPRDEVLGQLTQIAAQANRVADCSSGDEAHNGSLNGARRARKPSTKTGSSARPNGYQQPGSGPRPNGGLEADGAIEPNSALRPNTTRRNGAAAGTNPQPFITPPTNDKVPMRTAAAAPETATAAATTNSAATATATIIPAASQTTQTLNQSVIDKIVLDRFKGGK